jgi:hypothetical protein
LTWFNLIGYDSNSLATSYLTSYPLISGRIYRFKVRARNLLGWSAFSDILNIQAATWPEVGQAPNTAYDSVTGGILV